MMIVMKPTATEEDILSVIDRIESCGARAHPSRGEEVAADLSPVDLDHRTSSPPRSSGMESAR